MMISNMDIPPSSNHQPGGEFHRRLAEFTISACNYFVRTGVIPFKNCNKHKHQDCWRYSCILGLTNMNKQEIRQ